MTTKQAGPRLRVTHTTVAHYCTYGVACADGSTLYLEHERVWSRYRGRYRFDITPSQLRRFAERRRRDGYHTR